MARKPADQVANAARPEGREVIWAAIRRLKVFCLLDLEHETRIRTSTIKTYLTGLTAAGYIARIPDPREGVDPRFQRAYWTVPDDAEREAPRVRRDGSPVVQGRVREHLWRTMKILGVFTYRDLIVNATTEECTVRLEDARSYCRMLCAAGYIERIARGRFRDTTRYRFLRDTGPRPPQVQRVKQVWDANLGEVVWRQGDGGTQ